MELAILAECNHPAILTIKGVYFSSEKLEISFICPRYFKDLNSILFE